MFSDLLSASSSEEELSEAEELVRAAGPDSMKARCLAALTDSSAALGGQHCILGGAQPGQGFWCRL